MRSLALTCLATLAALTAFPAWAQDAAGRSMDATAMQAGELEALRGGLRTPTGVEFGFGAVVRSYVDGALALETQLTWTDQGVIQLETARAAGGLSLEAAGVGIPANSGWTGLVLPGDGGSTALLQALDAGLVNNVVLNTANNRDIRQETLITLNLPALDQIQRDAVTARLGMEMNNAVGAALANVAAH